MDLRWRQRFDNFVSAVGNLDRGLALGSWNEFEKQGVIKAFELCYELAWKTLQDLLADRGFEGILGPKAVLRESFLQGWLLDADLWAKIHEGRNRAAHVYDQKSASRLFDDVQQSFTPAFHQLGRTLEVFP